MRKFVVLVLSVAMVGGGLFLIANQFICGAGEAEGPCRFSGKFAMAGALPVTLGLFLLWEDFLAPIFRRKNKE